MLIISVMALNTDIAKGEINPEWDLITVTQTKDVVHQYETLSVSVDLDENLTLDDVVIATNIEAVVKGIPSLSEQIPYAQMETKFNIDRENDSILIDLNVIDQMIWFDGERMLDNITVTMAFICYHNGTDDLETINIKLVDVNDPPVISGDLEVIPDTIHTGDDVEFSTSGVIDIDHDDLELVWSSGERVLGTGNIIHTTFNSPGTYTVILGADDGNKTVEKAVTVEVLPVPGEEPDEPSNEENETKDPIVIEEEEEEGPPWLIIPVLILLIAVIVVMGMALKLKKDQKEEGPKRYLWSMSPLRGPSPYEKDSLNDRLKNLHGSEHSKKDLEMRLDEDFENWSSQWRLDIFF